MTPQRAVVLGEIASRIAAIRRQHPRRIAIDGPDAAGKTTFADDLARWLGTSRTPVIRATIDGFHRPLAERHARGSLSPEGCYRDTFDLALLRRHLLDPLGPGGTRAFRRAVFDRVADRAVVSTLETAPPDAILVFDGVFLQRPELADAWDYCIYLDCPEAEILRRAEVRDGSSMGSAAVVAERYRERYLPAQRLYRAEADPLAHADAIIHNENPDEPRLVLLR